MQVCHAMDIRTGIRTRRMKKRRAENTASPFSKGSCT
jgi:hypothetical protein